ncbi:MAG: prealbumin-like fold domain-containing protein, partial [Ruminococcus bromii]|nr:prealbumin-like fold domain-containing protein [Ruminococcus bromii]
KALAGATFELYTNEKDAAAHNNAIASGTSDSDGKVKFLNSNGEERFLSSGNYFISETAAPEGYNLYGDVIPVTIDVEYNEVFNDTWVKNSPADGYATCTVTDTKLIVPQTGGYVWVLYATGTVLVLAGLSLLIFTKAKKKKNNK